MKKLYGQIGVPLSEVSNKLTALDECLRKNDMALKSKTGVHIECIEGHETYAIELTLNVVLFSTNKEEENG